MSRVFTNPRITNAESRFSRIADARKGAFLVCWGNLSCISRQNGKFYPSKYCKFATHSTSPQIPQPPTNPLCQFFVFCTVHLMHHSTYPSPGEGSPTNQ